MTSGKTSEDPVSAVDQWPLITQPLDEISPSADADSCRLCQPADAEAWDRYVAAQSQGNLGHAFGWKQVIEEAYGKTTCFLAAFAKEAITGVLPLVHMRGPLSGNRLVSLPFLDQAGLLASTPAAARGLWQAARELARARGARGFDLRARGPENSTPSDRATLVLTLDTSAEALWKSFSPKVRNQVRKAEKEGLKTTPAEAAGLEDFYPVFAHNMRDLGSPTHSRRFLQAVLATFGAAAKIYLTRDGSDRVVGGALALRWGDTVTVPWASSLREVFSSCPNHSLYWQILSDAAEAGAGKFDFGRSHLNSGTYKFKTQWGAEPHPLLWTAFDASGRPEAQRVYKPSEHQALTWVWSRLPVPLATWLGPLVRRQLSN